MFGVGLFVSARLSHQAKMGPLESSRNLAFTDSAEWNQFYDAGSVRRFVGLARQGEAQEITEFRQNIAPRKRYRPRWLLRSRRWSRRRARTAAPKRLP